MIIKDVWKSNFEDYYLVHQVFFFKDKDKVLYTAFEKNFLRVINLKSIYNKHFVIPDKSFLAL